MPQRRQPADPVRLFGLAVRDGDLVLAGLLADSLARDPALRPRMSAELKRGQPARGAELTLPILRVVGGILRGLRALDRERGRG